MILYNIYIYIHTFIHTYMFYIVFVCFDQSIEIHSLSLSRCIDPLDLGMSIQVQPCSSLNDNIQQENSVEVLANENHTSTNNTLW